MKYKELICLQQTKVLALTTQKRFAQSAGAVEYTDCFSARGNTPTTSVVDMTLNNLMTRFQQCWSFGECGVLLYCHHYQGHSLGESYPSAEIQSVFSATPANWAIWFADI